MAIYARCPKCRKDNTSTIRLCKGCKAKLDSRFIVKVKDSRTGKWRSKTVLLLKQAREVEAKLKVQLIEGNFFDRTKANDFSFERYLKHSKLTKRFWIYSKRHGTPQSLN